MSFWHRLLLFITTTVALMVVALYNGFPLVESDTGAYIEQAIYPHFAPDRTPIYGLFLRITTLWTSLWYTVVAQCLILSFLLLQYIASVRRANGSGSDFNLSLLAVIATVTFTCVSWVTSYLMPDVFAGMLLLAVWLFLTAPASQWKIMALYAIIIFGCISIHNSHFAIMSALSVLLIAGAWFRKQRTLVIKGAVLLAMCCCVYGAMSAANVIKKHGFVFSRGADIFMMAKLTETGILHQYLDENCRTKNYRICAWKDHLPGNLNEFLWSGESPLYKLGGWDSNKAEYKAIVHDVFTTPRYAGMFARKSLVCTMKELTQVQAPNKIVPFGKDSEPWKKVNQYFEEEVREYSTSMQNQGSLSADAANFVYYLFLIISTLWMIWMYPRVMNRDMRLLYGFILAFFVLNASVTATLSTVIYRYQYRIAWILPATNAIVILQYYRNKFFKPQPQHP